VTLADLYADVMKAYETVPDSFETFVRKGLLALSKEDWEAQFTGETPLLNLAVIMAASRAKFRAGQPLQDALKGRAVALLQGQAAPQLPSVGWSAVFSLLAPGASKTLMRDIRDELLSHTDGDVEKLIDFAGEPLIASDLLVARADEFVRRIGEVVVEAPGTVSLVWFERALRAQSSILGAAEAETRASLLIRVETHLTQGGLDELASAPLERLRELIRGAATESPPSADSPS
jgi:hypothetical protein